RIRADEKVELNPRGVVRLGVERQKRDDDAEAEKVDEDRQEDDEENRLPVRDHAALRANQKAGGRLGGPGFKPRQRLGPSKSKSAETLAAAAAAAGVRVLHREA